MKTSTKAMALSLLLCSLAAAPALADGFHCGATTVQVAA